MFCTEEDVGGSPRTKSRYGVGFGECSGDSFRVMDLKPTNYKLLLETVKLIRVIDLIEMYRT